MNKIDFPVVSQNKNVLPSHSQPTRVSSQSKVSWTKIAKGIALLGGLIVAGYSLYLLKGRFSATPPSSCFANGKPAIQLNGAFCCLGDSNCQGPGAGTFHWSNGISYPGNLANGVFTGQGLITLSNGDSYNGDLVDGDRHGEGTYTYAVDGSSYTGSFVKNAHTGMGEFKYANKVSSYKGPFLDGHFSGPNGLLVVDAQESFQGDFLNGKPHGQVTHTVNEQESFKGDFVDGKAHGQVTYIIKGRFSYTGAFFQDKQHGTGTITFPDGTTCADEWVNGVMASHEC
jgi:hypothetical protein